MLPMQPKQSILGEFDSIPDAKLDSKVNNDAKLLNKRSSRKKRYDLK